MTFVQKPSRHDSELAECQLQTPRKQGYYNTTKDPHHNHSWAGNLVLNFAKPQTDASFYLQENRHGLLRLHFVTGSFGIVKILFTNILSLLSCKYCLAKVSTKKTDFATFDLGQKISRIKVT